MNARRLTIEVLVGGRPPEYRGPGKQGSPTWTGYLHNRLSVPGLIVETVKGE